MNDESDPTRDATAPNDSVCSATNSSHTYFQGIYSMYLLLNCTLGLLNRSFCFSYAVPAVSCLQRHDETDSEFFPHVPQLQVSLARNTRNP